MSTQKNLYPIVTLIILIFSLSCEKETNNINSNLKLAKEFHIKTISKELASFSKALTPIFNNQQNLNLLKEAIYLKKRDENITINDLNKSLESSFNFEQELYTNLTKINKISFEENVSWPEEDVIQEQSALGVYEIKNGKITRAWYFY